MQIAKPFSKEIDEKIREQAVIYCKEGKRPLIDYQKQQEILQYGIPQCWQDRKVS